MASKHKQKHLLRHKIEQKRQDLSEQKDELISMIFEHVDGVLSYAETKVRCSGHDLPMETYLQVMQMLDKCSNNCFCLMATAEKVMENADSEFDGLSVSSEELQCTSQLGPVKHITSVISSSLEKDNDVDPVRISCERDHTDDVNVLNTKLKEAEKTSQTTVSSWIEKQSNYEDSKTLLSNPDNSGPTPHAMPDAGQSSMLSTQSEKKADTLSSVQKDSHILQKFVSNSNDKTENSAHNNKDKKDTSFSQVQTIPSDCEINTETNTSKSFPSVIGVPHPSTSLKVMPQQSESLTIPSDSATQPSILMTQASNSLIPSSDSLSLPSAFMTQLSVSVTQPSAFITQSSESLTQPSTYVTQQLSDSLTQPYAFATQQLSESLTQPSTYVTWSSDSSTQPSAFATQQLSVSLTQQSAYVIQSSDSLTQPSAFATQQLSESLTQPSAYTIQSSDSLTQPPAFVTPLSGFMTPSSASLTSSSASFISMPPTAEYQDVSGQNKNQLVVSDCNMSSHGATTVMSSHGATPVMSSHGAAPVMPSHGATPVMSSHGATPVMSSHGVTPVTSDVTGNGLCCESPMMVKTVTLVPDTTVRVVVSEIDTPWSFYVQPVSQVLDDLRNKIQCYIATVDPVVTKVEPRLGMMCLAPFLQEDPPLYYRAQIIRTFNVSEESKAEVLYVDFGNTGHVSPLTIVPLPEEFSSLPSQAIFCALSGIAPANKLGVWTEDEIQGFRTCVIGQQLFLQPTYCANNNLFPYLVDLFWNIPILPSASPDKAQQLVFSRLTLCDILVQKDIARLLSISEQITKLRTLFGDIELDLTKVLFSRSSKACQTKVEEKVSVKTEPVATNGGEINDGIVDSVKVKSDLPRDIKLASVDEVQISCNQNKYESQEQTNETKKMVPKPTSLHHRMRRIIVGKRRARSTLMKSSCDNIVDVETSESKIKVTYSKPLVEGSPMTKDEENINSSLSKDLNNDSQKCPSKDVSNVNRQPSPSDSQVSNKEPELKEKNEISKLFPSGDYQSNCVSEDVVTSSVTREQSKLSNLNSEELRKSNICFDVLISHIGTPNNFHVHCVSSETGKTLERLMKDLNQLFERRSNKQLKKLHKELIPKVNNLCCAEFSRDNCFYRAQIMEVNTQCGSGDADDSSGAMSRLRVFYLDFGDEEWLPKAKVYPLPDEFCYLPPLAIWCSLAHVVPLDLKDCEKGFAVPAKKWSEKGIKVFEELAEFEKKLKLSVVSGSFEIKSKRCHAQTEPVQVFLTDNTRDEEICINLELMNRDLAMLDFDLPYLTTNKITKPDDDIEHFEQLDFDAHWNPMAEDFMSLRNSYNVDIDDPGVATIGYKSKDEQRICRFFNTPGKCWRGDNCLYRHVTHPQGLTQDQVAVYALDEDQSEILPEEGSVVAVDVCTILSPHHFYVNLPWGKTPIAQLQKNPKDAIKKIEDEETLEDLVKSMNNYYKNKMSLDHDSTLLAPGQAVAARCPQNGMWYRAKVTDSNVEEEKIEVFFADFGNTSWIDEREIRELQPEFLHLAQQAIECFLCDIELPSGDDQWSDDARNYFKQLVDGKTLVAFIKSRSWSGSLQIDLYDTENSEDLNIRDALVVAKHAEKIGSNKQDSSHSRKSLTNRKIKLMPG